MSKVFIKNKPKLTLRNLIKRRKTTMQKFVDDAGIQSYIALVNFCARLGVEPPDKKYFESETSFKPVNSQQDGIIIFENNEVASSEVDDQLDDDLMLDINFIEEKQSKKKKRKSRKIKNEEKS